MSNIALIFAVVITVTLLVSTGVMFAGVVHILPPVVGMVAGVSMLVHVVAIGYLIRDDF